MSAPIEPTVAAPAEVKPEETVAPVVEAPAAEAKVEETTVSLVCSFSSSRDVLTFRSGSAQGRG
jgi:hypothetical protein